LRCYAVMNEEGRAMIPKMNRIDTTQVSRELKLVAADQAAPDAPQTTSGVPAPSRLRPELQKAADASWKRNEEAYRYLGR
jgi:hypothetical protein